MCCVNAALGRACSIRSRNPGFPVVQEEAHGSPAAGPAYGVRRPEFNAHNKNHISTHRQETGKHRRRRLPTRLIIIEAPPLRPRARLAFHEAKRYFGLSHFYYGRPETPCVSRQHWMKGWKERDPFSSVYRIATRRRLHAALSS